MHHNIIRLLLFAKTYVVHNVDFILQIEIGVARSAFDLAVREPVLEVGNGAVGDLAAGAEVDPGQVRAVRRERGNGGVGDVVAVDEVDEERRE